MNSATAQLLGVFDLDLHQVAIGPLPGLRRQVNADFAFMTVPEDFAAQPKITRGDPARAAAGGGLALDGTVRTSGAGDVIVLAANSALIWALRSRVTLNRCL